MKTTFEINIDYKGMEIAIEEATETALKELAPIIQKYARTNHKYENRTGNLTKSTITKHIKNFLVVQNDISYAPYVKDPHGTWSGDNWIENSIADNEQLIMTTIQKHIDLAIDKINRR